jgi:hypothetical protein
MVTESITPLITLALSESEFEIVLCALNNQQANWLKIFNNVVRDHIMGPYGKIPKTRFDKMDKDITAIDALIKRMYDEKR